MGYQNWDSCPGEVMDHKSTKMENYLLPLLHPVMLYCRLLSELDFLVRHLEQSNLHYWKAKMNWIICSNYFVFSWAKG